MLEKAKTLATMEFTATASPRPGLSLSEARDKWLEANPKHRIHDYGDKAQPVLLVAAEKSREVAYEFLPELAPPGMSIEQAAAHMLAAGYDVRGLSADRKHIITVETTT